MRTKLNKLTNWQVVIIIALVGFAVFFTGLTNPFQGDDIDQIVRSVPIHSISHVKLLFEGGTFYAGQGLKPLSGGYFRPLMTTVFSLIYTMFGAHPFYYHFFQLLLCIGSAIVLYMFFRYSFRPLLALFLSLTFLVHPINSQVVFAIPSMQDALFFFFGISALWMLVRFRSIKGLIPVAICLFLALLSKETAVLFIIMSMLYLFWWNRERLYSFMGIMIVPVALWLALRLHAVGLFSNPYGGPIDRLSLAGRLFTTPSILLFYITKFLFPWKLSSAYYWVYPKFSARHFLLPLIIDLAVVVLVAWFAVQIRKKASRAQYMTYLFFTIWSSLGLLMLLQIAPLDMTACEIWFYFPMAGILGMVGVILTVFPLRLHPDWLLVVVIVLIGLLGFRTADRGLDWRNPYNLALKDIANSQSNYRADNIVVSALMNQGKYAEARPYAENAESIYPSFSGYINLAAILINTGDYAGATTAYSSSLKYAAPSTIQQAYDGRAALTVLTGTGDTNQTFLVGAVQKLPQDSTLWLYLAILEARDGNAADAKIAISNAARYGQVPQNIYSSIMNNQSFNLDVAGKYIRVP